MFVTSLFKTKIISAPIVKYHDSGIMWCPQDKHSTAAMNIMWTDQSRATYESRDSCDIFYSLLVNFTHNQKLFHLQYDLYRRWKSANMFVMYVPRLSQEIIHYQCWTRLHRHLVMGVAGSIVYAWVLSATGHRLVHLLRVGLFILVPFFFARRTQV